VLATSLDVKVALTFHFEVGCNNGSRCLGILTTFKIRLGGRWHPAFTSFVSLPSCWVGIADRGDASYDNEIPFKR
jgi:hypothetical protein